MKNVRTDKRRLVMRNDIGKVLLNASMYAGMKFEQEKAFLKFNAMVDGAEADNGVKEAAKMVRFLLKAKLQDIDPLKAALDGLVPAAR
jgi:energy-coupling factor transporter ATP-binding protein EcfA2